VWTDGRAGGRADGRTDRHEEANSRFLNFANAPKNKTRSVHLLIFLYTPVPHPSQSLSRLHTHASLSLSLSPTPSHSWPADGCPTPINVSPAVGRSKYSYISQNVEDL
jgi:hypothetical protein